MRLDLVPHYHNCELSFGLLFLVQNGIRKRFAARVEPWDYFPLAFRIAGAKSDSDCERVFREFAFAEKGKLRGDRINDWLAIQRVRRMGYQITPREKIYRCVLSKCSGRCGSYSTWWDAK